MTKSLSSGQTRPALDGVSTSPVAEDQRCAARIAPSTVHGAMSGVHTVPDGSVPAFIEPAAITGVAAQPPASNRARRSADVTVAVLAADMLAIGVTALATASTTSGLVLIATAMLLARGGLRAYRPRLHLSALDDIPRLAAAGLICLGVIFGFRQAFLGGDSVATRSAVQVVSIVVLSTVFTAVMFAVVRRRRIANADSLPATLVVGSGHVGSVLHEAITEHPELGLRGVGVLGRNIRPSALARFGDDLANDPAALVRAVEVTGASVAVLAFHDATENHMDSVVALHKTGCTLFVVPSAFALHHDGPDVDRVRGIPLIRLRPDPTSRPSWLVKRALDVVVASLGLLFIAPVLLATALAILIESGRPIFFRQVRIGLDGKPFELLKFRSMRPATQIEGETKWNIANDPRLTTLGKWLRRTSVDEVPQLLNILRGQMTLVGPRPERPVFVEQFSAEHELYWARHRVPAGLTGLAQVNGLRGDTSIRERARYDNYYIANWSLWLDIKVLLLTAREVLGGRGG